MPLVAFALLLAVAALGALLRGGAIERKGVALFVVAWLVSLAAQAISGEPSPGLWLPIVDAVVLAALAALAWRSPRPWPVYACGFQMLALAGDVAKWVEADLDVRLHLTLLSVMAFGALGTLIAGTWLPPRTHRE